MTTSSPSIDQIISQAGIMNSSHFDIETLFEEFGDQPQQSKRLQTTDDLMQAFVHQQASPSVDTFARLQQQQQQAHMASPMMGTPCLDAFNTPFTPATTFNSPMMATPYMDPLIGSHFSTPLVDASATPFMGAAGMDLDCVEQYFTPAMDTLPDSQFSAAVDPSHLMDNSYVHPSSTTATTAVEEDDSLFPPLTNDDDSAFKQPLPVQQQQQQQPHHDWDSVFDDIFGTNELPSNEMPSNEMLVKDNKRKRTDDIEQQRADDAMNKKQQKVESNGRLFVCDICDRSFSRRYNLGTHIKTHNKQRVKPYACHLCPKSFDRKHDCERHISTVHLGERLYTCHSCCVSFSRRDALHRHQAQKHVN